MSRRHKFRYSPRQLNFLRAVYRFMRIEDVTEAFNTVYGTHKSAVQIGSALKAHSIKCGRKCGDRFIRRERLFSKRHLEFLRRHYRTHNLVDLTVLFNHWFGTAMTMQQIRSAVRNHHIPSGRTGQFEKGHRTWNAGTKGQGLTGRNRGSFRKGDVPPNRKPLGSERINRDGRIEIKVAEKDPYTGFPTRYKLKHVHIWEQAHGPVPKGKAVVFVDGDRCELDNLMLISRAELLNLNRHRYRSVPGELKPSVLALSGLQVKTWAKEKEA